MSIILDRIRNEKIKWKKLEEIGVFFGGLTGKTKYDFINGNCKYVPYKNIFSNIEVGLNYLETVNIGEEKQNKLKYGDILFTGSSENKEECGLSSVITKDVENLYLNSFCFGYRFNENIKILPSFSKYLFRDYRIRKEIIKISSGVTRYNVSKERMKKIEIPIPSLETQEKIIEILDKFRNYTTELQEKLKEELDLRIKQYEYYRDYLLSEEYLRKETKKLNGKNKIHFKKLSDCIQNIENIKWENLNVNESRMYIDLSSVEIKYNEINECSIINKENAPSRAKQIVKTEDIIFATTRPMQKRVCYIKEKYNNQIASTGFCVLRANKEKVLAKWLYYNLCKSDFYKYVELNLTGTAYPSISNQDVKKFIIPIPPMEIQKYVVSVLDKFNKITNDLKEGIPAEINLRQKQYEYYREKLFDFS